MKNTIKILALITVTVAAVKAFERVNKGKCIFCGGLSELKINNEDFNTIRNNQIKIYRNYKNLSTRNSNIGKPDSYWLHTMGFDKSKEQLYQKLQ